MFGKDSRSEFRVRHHNPRGGVTFFVHKFGSDSRRLEIVADPLTLFCITLVSPLHCDCSTTNIDGAVLAVARHKKETIFQELIRPMPGVVWLFWLAKRAGAGKLFGAQLP